MPKVIRARNLISAGEVEIPDQLLPKSAELPANIKERAEASAAPQPNLEESRRAAEELLRSRLEQMQTQAEETSSKILRRAGEERERILEEARAESDEIRRQAREEAYRVAVEEKCQRIENLLGSTEALLNQLAQQQRQYFTHYEKALPDLAMEIAAKVMEHTLQTDPTVLKPLVQRAVAQVKNAEWLEVQVSRQLPELAQELREELQEWTDIRHVEVTEDQNELGACIVQTPQGIIDASVSTQLDNLKKRLHTPVRN